jgi:hypothetical protein
LSDGCACGLRVCSGLLLRIAHAGGSGPFIRPKGGNTMADTGIFIAWGKAARGREEEATQVFNEAVAYYTRLQEEGVIESWEPVLLEAHGGDLAGFFLLRGEQDKLARLRATEEFQHLSLRASLFVDSLGVVTAAIGERVAKEMAYYGEQVAALT